MEILNTLLVRNRSWAKQQKRRNPEFFLNHVSGQQPQALWIGCSDSRVPAEVLTCAQPGELFVHRNIANMVLEEDDSLMSVLEYALLHLQVTAIVLCGHYGCGGVKAALKKPPISSGENSALTRRLVQLHQSLQDYINIDHEDENTSFDHIVEYHVLCQFSHLLQCSLVREAFIKKQDLDIYGCVYDLHSGHLKQLIHEGTN
ncbi:carbonic anhydrase [Pantoea sp. BAV 3049]|uniref:carbonic anhydrase n=1 Tax=Pantoea sp. BAV 3049 TaxID=2654188 RepID=UPI00131AE2B0|nr:carbonic anhydrase [Pantoea sp. BAV 3049]